MSKARWRKWGLMTSVVLAVVVVEGAVVFGFWWGERASLKAALEGFTSIPPDMEHPWVKYQTGGGPCPPALPAEMAEVADTDLVIGVTARGQARAYTINALSDRRQHVVNDVVGGIPVTVAFCDLTQCVRAYTKSGESKPLEVEQHGFWNDAGMVLKIKDVDYFHQTGEPIAPGPGATAFPYEEYPWVRTTWKEWKRQYPRTDVYVGESGSQPASPASAGSPNGVADASSSRSSALTHVGSSGQSKISGASPRALEPKDSALGHPR